MLNFAARNQIRHNGSVKARMWGCSDKVAQTPGILSTKIRHVDVRPSQAVFIDGKATQPGAGRSRSGKCKAGAQARRRIHVS